MPSDIRRHLREAVGDPEHGLDFERIWVTSRKFRLLRLAKISFGLIAALGLTTVLVTYGNSLGDRRTIGPSSETLPGRAQVSSKDDPNESNGGPFQPPQRRKGDSTILPLTFPDGSEAELVYPSNVVIGDQGILPYTSGKLLGQSRDFWIFHESLRDVISRFVEPRLLTEFQGSNGMTVGLWRFAEDPEVNYLTFEFGSWTVLVYDYQTVREGGMTEEQRALWASHLQGDETDEGFLILKASSPLMLATATGSSAGPQLVLEGSDGGLTLIPGECVAYSESNTAPGSEIRIIRGLSVLWDSPRRVEWCDSKNSMTVRVQGSETFVQALISELEVRNVSLKFSEDQDS